jgi:hypothetical protein
LIDEEASRLHKSRLFRFIAEMRKNPIALKPVVVKKASSPKGKSGGYQSKLGQKRSQ